MTIPGYIILNGQAQKFSKIGASCFVISLVFIRSGTVGLDIGCDLCSVEVHAVLYLQIVLPPLIIGSPV
jgi:hypothetical protein